MRAQLVALALAAIPLTGVSGCAPGILWLCGRPEVTAVSLNPADGDKCGKECGVPFYLPKPLLIVSKNFRNIESPTVGLTDTAPIPVGFDDQSKYADLNARTNFNGLNGAAVSGAVAPADVANPGINTGTAMKSAPTLHSLGAPLSPGKAPSDMLAPETFYTYQIVFVPDMTQRYGLKIRGGPGEIRAAMNLVNGWQFTGIGPFYMKDSSTAQDILASGIATRLGGQAAADVLNASADLAKALGGRQGAAVGAEDRAVQRLSETITQLPLGHQPMTLVDFAEIHVYEPNLTPEGMMEWHEITHLQFNRDYLGVKTVCVDMAPRKEVDGAKPDGGGKPPGGLQGAAVPPLVDDAVARAAVAGVFGLPANSPALQAAPAGGLQGGAVPAGGLQGGAVGATPAGGVNQIQVECGGAGGCQPCKEFNFIKFGGCKKEEPRAKIQNRYLSTGAAIVPGLMPPAAAPPGGAPPGGLVPGGGLQGGAVPGGGAGAGAATPPIINQPIFNQPAPSAPAPTYPPMKPVDRDQ
jgi:hypothetical protein